MIKYYKYLLLGFNFREVSYDYYKHVEEEVVTKINVY